MMPGNPTESSLQCSAVRDTTFAALPLPPVVELPELPELPVRDTTFAALPLLSGSMHGVCVCHVLHG